jgi:RES domain-containing protein
MTVYRVVKKQYAADAYSGEGSRLTTGRWHTKGTSICYASTSIALAILEVIVHFQPISTVPELVVVSATIPKDLCTDVYELYSLDSLDNEIKTREIGDSWILNAQSLALKVPSAIVPKEANILINPHHKRIKSVKITETFEFILDRRLLKR